MSCQKYSAECPIFLLVSVYSLFLQQNFINFDLLKIYFIPCDEVDKFSWTPYCIKDLNRNATKTGS